MRGCVESARRTQLRPYVAPRALLFVTAPGTGDTTLRLAFPAPVVTADALRRVLVQLAQDARTKA